jgi:hypothetical protein
MSGSNAESQLAGELFATLSAAAAIPDRGALVEDLDMLHIAAERGYFLPAEDEWVKVRYSQYLAVRAALLATIGTLGAAAGSGTVAWSQRLPVFATAFAAACVLLRADRFLVDLAMDHPLLWKKLDEADSASGIPRKSFTGIHKALGHPVNLARFLEAADFYRHHREEIHALAEDEALAPLVGLLKNEEERIEGRRRDALKRHASYRWFSFLRRHRSAWKKAMGGLFEVSGRAIAELRQPGVKARGEGKRVDSRLRAGVLELLQPGDVVVTRHDDALSNWFLPGFWPHAALYLGASAESGGEHRFLEAKKDGVRIRPAAETLAVDSLLVLRPPLSEPERAQAVDRALTHLGKPYDFLFDFRTADRLVCTELVYRGYQGIGGVEFQLKEVGGRRCLPAEELIDQALASGFQLLLLAGVQGREIVTGREAAAALLATRRKA